MSTALAQARAVLALGLYDDRPTLRHLATLIAASADGQTPRQIRGQA